MPNNALERDAADKRPRGSALTLGSGGGALDTLADIAIEHFCLLMFSGAIDPDDAGSLMQSIPAFLESMSAEEQPAFSAAAQRALDHVMAEPDVSGYSPRRLISEEERAFLEAAAAGEIFGR